MREQWFPCFCIYVEGGRKHPRPIPGDFSARPCPLWIYSHTSGQSTLLSRSSKFQSHSINSYNGHEYILQIVVCWFFFLEVHDRSYFPILFCRHKGGFRPDNESKSPAFYFYSYSSQIIRKNKTCKITSHQMHMFIWITGLRENDVWK